MKQDSTHSISRAAGLFFSGTLLSRITGLLRDMSIAFAFGADSAIAAFMMAYRFAHLLRRLLGEGPMQSALIPYYEQLRQESAPRACLFFRNLTASICLLLLCIIVAAMTTLGLWVSFGSPSPGNREVAQLTFLMLPSLFFICLFGLNLALLQCEGRYFVSSLAPAAFNLIWICGTFWLHGLPVSEAMPRLSLFVVLGCLGQWLFTMPQTLAVWKKTMSSSLWKGISFFSHDVRKLIKPLSLGIIGVAAAQVNSACDTLFARYADPEGPAQLWYAIRLQQLPLALFGIALAGALLPPLARSIKSEEKEQFLHFLGFAIRRSIAFMLPLTIAIFVLGGEAVNLVYAHGDFNLQDALSTTHCLWGYSVGLIPMTLTLVIAPAFFAQGNYRAPTIASVVSMGVNILFNAIAIFLLGYGSASVAYATGLSAWVNLFLLTAQVAKQVGPLDRPAILKSSLQVTLSSGAAAFTALAVCLALADTNSLLAILSNTDYPFPHRLTAQLSHLFFPSLAALATLFLAARRLRASDLLALFPRKKQSSLQ